jgi:hypothetical protein
MALQAGADVNHEARGSWILWRPTAHDLFPSYDSRSALEGRELVERQREVI